MPCFCALSAYWVFFGGWINISIISMSRLVWLVQVKSRSFMPFSSGKSSSIIFDTHSGASLVGSQSQIDNWSD